jgi:hypothetical protein
MSFSSGFNFSSKGTKSGGRDWESKLCFLDRNKYNRIEILIFKENDFGNLKRKIGSDEEIDKIFIYSSPLTKVQISAEYFHHEFVLFETHSWWWTIEKTSEGIILSRAKSKDYVMNFSGNNKRNRPIDLLIEDSGLFTVFQLIDWLKETSQLRKGYEAWDFDSYYRKNCIEFAKDVFDKSSKYKTYYTPNLITAVPLAIIKSPYHILRKIYWLFQ